MSEMLYVERRVLICIILWQNLPKRKNVARSFSKKEIPAFIVPWQKKQHRVAGKCELVQCWGKK
jgi:esterase/lipase superfamily enzyme